MPADNKHSDNKHSDNKQADNKQADAAPAPKYVAKPDGADPFATRLVAELQHDRGILACRYDRQASFLFAGARDYFLHRWDLSQPPAVAPPADPKQKPKVPPVPAAPPESRTELAGHESWVSGVALFDDGDRIATGDFVGRLIVWSGRTGDPKPICSFEAHQGSIRKVAVSSDGKLVATAGNDGAVRLWHAGGEQKLHRELLGHDCHVYHIAFHPDGKSLVSADLKGRLRHWDVGSGKLLRELDAGALYVYSEKYQVDVGGVRGMSFNADGTRLACAGAVGDKGIAHSGNARVLLFDWESGRMTHELRPEKEEICTAWGVQFHPDGFLVASGGSRTGGFLWFWAPKDTDAAGEADAGDDGNVAFHTLKFRLRAPGFDLDISPDNKTLAVANHDGAVRLYEMAAAPPAAADKQT